MPRRSSARSAAIDPEPPLNHPSPALQPTQPLSDDLILLRHQWKWAAFSQFFFTFAPLFAMNDVSLKDIEDDLTNGTNIFLPRIMQRLLYTLTYDRKISLETWQTTLRKQYLKRDPLANPLGPEPFHEALDTRYRSSSIVKDTPDVERDTKSEADGGTHPESSVPIQESLAGDTGSDVQGGSISQRVTPDAEMRDEVSYDENGLRPHEGKEEGSDIEDTEESKDWLDLPVLVKLDSMHLLTEWQFQNPTRLRSIMKSDGDGAEWRIEPIGYDSKLNAYWLIGADRLWIQRVIPKPRSLKRKKKADTPAKTKGKGKPTAKRPRLESDDEPVDIIPPPQKKSHKKGAGRVTITLPANGGRASRAAKAQANLKLDAQAKELAELNRQAALLASGSGGATRSSKRQKLEALARPLGTRLSARLRGAEDEWQPVPDEWLEDAASSSSLKGKGKVQNQKRSTVPKTGLESDEESISDLTELSEETINVTVGETSHKDDLVELSQTKNGSGQAATDAGDPEEPQVLPDGFLEWETICVTLYEWEHVAEQFAKATHYTEKALHKVLTNDIVPLVTGELREIERKRRLEEALVHRKRSSRLAMKESEKEEAKAAARKRAEEQEKQSRAKRLESRLQKEEAERERRESAREQRRREREARELANNQQETGSDIQVDIIGETSTGNNHLNGTYSQGKFRFPGPVHRSGSSGSHTPVGDDWELDCEICLRRGINLDDGTPMMSCGRCFKWQHIACHDQADFQAGFPKRNWDVEEFICTQCRGKVLNHPSMSRPQQLGQSAASPYVPVQPIARGTANHVSTSSQVGTINYSNGAPPKHNSHLASQLHPAPIAFTHYQPAQRGFSSTQIHQQYNAPTTQRYGSSQAASSQISQYSDIGTSGQLPSSYQRTPPSQVGWNVVTHPQAVYNSSTERPNIDYNPELDRQYGMPTTQWQPPVATPAVQSSTAQPFSQFRYHPTSYQSPT